LNGVTGGLVRIWWWKLSLVKHIAYLLVCGPTKLLVRTWLFQFTVSFWRFRYLWLVILFHLSFRLVLIYMILLYFHFILWFVISIVPCSSWRLNRGFLLRNHKVICVVYARSKPSRIPVSSILSFCPTFADLIIKVLVFLYFGVIVNLLSQFWVSLQCFYLSFTLL
jgi:hypothetical protein